MNPKSGPKKWINPESMHYVIQLYTITEMLPLIIISHVKSGLIAQRVGLCKQKRGFKVYTAIFGSFINLIKQLTINSHAHCPETLLIQEHTVRVDYHC